MINLKRRTVLQMGLAGTALLAAGPAMALVKIVVSGATFTPLPIAIPDFASSDPAFGKRDRRYRARQPQPLGALRPR